MLNFPLTRVLARSPAMDRWVVAFVLVGLSGCAKQDSADASGPAAVLYTSVDETFARELVDRYAQRTGRRVQLVTDTEGGKTTGLVTRLRLEKDRPRADVFWSSEQSQTVLLAGEGLFAAYVSPAGADIPEGYKDPGRLWTGFALRARVVAYDPQRTKADEVPASWEAFAAPRHAARLAVANPLFGTTRGHVAAMQALWGAERFRAFLQGLVDGQVTVVDGNSTAVRRLLDGRVDFAFTDSDDVITARAAGRELGMVFPDMGDGGTMLIPNTVALIAGAPHPDAARQLIDYILSAEVEEALARSPSGNYPVRPELRARLAVELPPASRVSAREIAGAMPAAVEACREILLH